jgi:DNA-binding NarL/FixJ family response regulator
MTRASAAFMGMLTARFKEGELTAAEMAVALFAIKGLNVPEIAQLRETSEGTVKAQTAAIYRKSGVTGRPQLLSLFIDDMMGGSAAQPFESSENSGQSKARLRA